jgi:hypothetical protein
VGSLIYSIHSRIIVDFSEGLLRQQDVGFVAVNREGDPIFEASRGVMAAVDIQLRNSEKSHPGVRKVSGFPPHLHIKNMEVHQSMRNKGVGQGESCGKFVMRRVCIPDLSQMGRPERSLHWGNPWASLGMPHGS